jgi:putative endonuclease
MKPANPKDPRRQFGDLGERLARQHLLANGYTIVAQNYRTAAGEVDIIAQHADTLVFVEVRTRRGSLMGTAHESLSPAKQRRMAEMAESYEGPGLPEGRRVDLIAIDFAPDGRLLSLTHHENALTGD